MLIAIYFFGICFITLIISILFIFNEKKDKKTHLLELKKIKNIEMNIEKKEKELALIRSRTTPCPIDNLSDARSCYLDSNRQCSWNINTDRCDLIK